MLTIGITGHQNLKDPGGWVWVEEELNRVIHKLPRPWVGLTSLAIGADQLFARIVLESGERLRVILPSETYEENFCSNEERRNYRKLLKQASDVTILTGVNSEQESYLEAGKRIVDQSDAMIAIWDGQPAKGLGGTGDIVAYAFRSGKKIIHINPVVRRVEKT